MTPTELARELRLTGKVFSIRRARGMSGTALEGRGCDLKRFARLEPGQALVLTEGNVTCSGAARGIGLTDDIPDIPGGFGQFIAQGAGPGFPPGERVKCAPGVADQMMRCQPLGVMQGNDAVVITCLGGDGDADIARAELISAIVNPDQLSALVHLFAYRSPAYDQVIVPMASGCASIFRIPFGEMISGRNRAVVGNVDVFSRPHFPADALFFTMPAAAYRQILADADESVLVSPIWRGIKKRLG